MCELTWVASHLPQPIVWLLPFSFQRLQQQLLQVPDSLIWLHFRPPGGVYGIHQLAIDIDLDLVMGGMTDPDRA